MEIIHMEDLEKKIHDFLIAGAKEFGCSETPALKELAAKTAASFIESLFEDEHFDIGE